MSSTPVTNISFFSNMVSYSTDTYVNGFPVIRDGDFIIFGGGTRPFVQKQNKNIFVNGRRLITIGDTINGDVYFGGGSPDTYGGE